MNLDQILKGEKLQIADVGSTGGPEERWKKWESNLFFHTFDPDPRAQAWSQPSCNHPIGLWSTSCRMSLNLAQFPPATSLYKMHHAITDAFLHRDSLQQIGQMEIALERLDDVLKGERIDFLKIDAEGAELEILKGAEESLAHLLGFQVEACFCPIREGIPSFSDFEIFAKERHFQLFQLQREHWIRKNNLCTWDSSPQLIWGNALFLLSKQEFLQRLEKNKEPDKLLVKYCLILIAYQLYDYAYELCEERQSEAARFILGYLHSLPPPKRRDFSKIVLSLTAAGLQYFLTFSKDKRRHRLCTIRRKLRQLGQACLFLGRNGYAIYD